MGSDRRSRLISGATVAAIVIAIAAFIAISPSDDSIPRDRYTLAAEKTCLQSKQHIAEAANEGGGTYARQLVPIIVRWREELAELRVPPDRADKEQELDNALREVEIEVAQLARLVEEGDRRRMAVTAGRADIATGEVEQAIDNLGLSECGEATIAFAAGK
jgi:hypothetical protein